MAPAVWKTFIPEVSAVAQWVETGQLISTGRHVAANANHQFPPSAFTFEIGCCARAAKFSLVAAGVGLTSFQQVSEYFLLADTHLASRTSGRFWWNIPRLEREHSDALKTVEDANLPRPD